MRQPFSSPSASIFCGVSATANSAGVALLTPASVACAESTTATSRVKALTCSSSPLGSGRCTEKRRKISRTSSARVQRIGPHRARPRLDVVAAAFRRQARHFSSWAFASPFYNRRPWTTQIARLAADEPFFNALLTPHRSLGRTGFTILMGTLVFGWLATGAMFLSQGAWPVFGFFGLDVLLVYVAFRLNYRAARAREEVSVSRTALDIRKTAPSGRTEQHRFNPFWTRFSVARHAEIGITRHAGRGAGNAVSDRRLPQSRRSRELCRRLLAALARQR